MNFFGEPDEPVIEVQSEYKVDYNEYMHILAIAESKIKDVAADKSHYLYLINSFNILQRWEPPYGDYLFVKEFLDFYNIDY